MALYPNLIQRYHNPDDYETLLMIEEFYREAITPNQAQWAEASIDLRFLAGDQRLMGEIYGDNFTYQNKQFFFNHTRREVSAISGHQRKHRKSVIAQPLENASEQGASQYSKVLMWAMNHANGLEVFSKAFESAITVGMSLIAVSLDYSSDPISGDIRLENTAFNEFLIDPFFKKKDLSDCNYIYKRSYLTPQRIKQLIPEKADEIDDIPMNQRDGKFPAMPQNNSWAKNNLMAYDETWYSTYRDQKVLVDTQTGDTMEWTSPDDEALEEFMGIYPQLELITSQVPTVKLVIVVEGHLMYHGKNRQPNPLGIDCYPFIPVWCYYYPELMDPNYRCQGIVRGLRDPQFLYNRIQQIILDIVESQVNSGIKYKEDALVDPKDAFMTGQGKGLALKATAQMTDVEKMQAAQIPPGLFQLADNLSGEFHSVSAVSEEVLGSASDDVAGVLSMLRQGSSLTTLQPIFDSADESLAQLGKVMMKIIQANFTPGKIKKVTDEEPVPEFYNKAFGKYDITVEEGLNTTTQRQMQFAQMLEMEKLGIQMPKDEMIEASTLQNKTKIKEKMDQAQQQQMQMQQMQMQMEQEKAQAEIEKTRAQAVADQGLGVERVSRIRENQTLAETHKAQAEKDLELAELHKIEIIEKLDDLDLGHLERLLRLKDEMERRDDVQDQQKEAAQRVEQEMDLAQKLSPMSSRNQAPQPAL